MLRVRVYLNNLKWIRSRIKIFTWDRRGGARETLAWRRCPFFTFSLVFTGVEHESGSDAAGSSSVLT
jgi:hypothetical protein